MSLKKVIRNLPVGVEIDVQPVTCSLTVQDEDFLLIYSDGISEQDNPEGEEFGEDRIIALMKQTATSGDTLSEILPRTLDEFRQHTPQRDDMAFLLFKF